jgi:glycosyltransferase involved in cell wall biosynthesis
MTAIDTVPVRTSPLTETAHAKPISVCLLISSLEYGGAERQVIEMMRSFDRAIVNPYVCSLSREVPLARTLPEGGKELSIIEKRGRFDFTTVFRLASWCRRHRIDVVHAFLFDAEIAARLAAPFAGVSAVISSERNTDYVRPRLHSVLLKATQGLFDVMVSNSVAGKNFNIRTLGLPASRIEVVHNGVDVKRFSPNRSAGLGFRERLGIAPGVPVIGMVGSYKRQKAQDCFIRMAAGVSREFPDAQFLLVGEPLRDDFEDTSRFQTEVKQLAETLKLSDRCHFLGNQQDMNAVYNACDLTALLSHREGTPNVVLEAMACGVPAIVTDIADNALIVQHGETGFVVPRDGHELAAAHATKLLRDSALRESMGAAARTRACEQFSLRVAASRLESIYTRSVKNKTQPRSQN